MVTAVSVPTIISLMDIVYLNIFIVLTFYIVHVVK